MAMTVIFLLFIKLCFLPPKYINILIRLSDRLYVLNFYLLRYRHGIATVHLGAQTDVHVLRYMNLALNKFLWIFRKPLLN